MVWFRLQTDRRDGDVCACRYVQVTRRRKLCPYVTLLCVYDAVDKPLAGLDTWTVVVVGTPLCTYVQSLTHACERPGRHRLGREVGDDRDLRIRQRCAEA